jgi:two-component system, OmpR family, KDP operon response regulator KdpE
MGDRGQILVIDGEPKTCRDLESILGKQGYGVLDACSAEEALDFVRSIKFDLALLELDLPDKPGIELCREIRAAFDVAIIVLTARNGEADKVEALDAGADDYVTKPFGTLELLARVRAQLRRNNRKEAEELFASADFVIDFEGRTVSRQGRETRLTPKQYQLLRYMVSRPNTPLSHRTLLEAIWGKSSAEKTGLLQPMVMQIRKKIEPDPGSPRYLVTVPWFGYRFDPLAQDEST